VFIEFVESLRCLRPHESTWLVAAPHRMAGRSIVSGTLGCPACRAEYPIVDGVAYFGAEPGGPAAARVDPSPPADPELVLRAAALLGLAEGGGTAVLGGTWSAAAGALLELAPAHYLLLDPPYPARTGDGISVIRTAGTLPLAAACVRGVALDEATAGAPVLASAVHALRPGGRLVAPAGAPLPPEVRELARDPRHWVAEREAPPSPPVRLGLARRSGGGP
jgi:hypothetical protein